MRWFKASVVEDEEGILRPINQPTFKHRCLYSDDDSEVLIAVPDLATPEALDALTTRANQERGRAKLARRRVAKTTGARAAKHHADATKHERLANRLDEDRQRIESYENAIPSEWTPLSDDDLEQELARHGERGQKWRAQAGLKDHRFLPTRSTHEVGWGPPGGVRLKGPGGNDG